jgi:hypothetical protein
VAGSPRAILEKANRAINSQAMSRNTRNPVSDGQVPHKGVWRQFVGHVERLLSALRRATRFLYRSCAFGVRRFFGCAFFLTRSRQAV